MRTIQIKKPISVPRIGTMVDKIVENTVKTTHSATHATPNTIDCAAC
ncbi:MAG: hypothetical protein P8Y29_08830 [Gemmatimonadota bacterium]